MGRAEPLIAALRRQHARIDELAAEVSEGSNAGRREALWRMLDYVAMHEAAEQAFVHPLGLVSVSDPTLVQRRIEEEQEISALVARTELLDTGSVDFMIQFGLLEEALHAHGRAEEEQEAPALAAALPAYQVERLADVMGVVTMCGPAAPDADAGTPQWRAGTFDDLTRHAHRTFEAILHHT